jgi:hypothetical protein
MDPIELSDDDDFAPMPARHGPKKVRAPALRRGHGRIKKPSLKSVESSMSDEQYRDLFGSDSSDVEDNKSDEEEDVPLRDLKRPKRMSSDEVVQVAGNAHKSLMTLLSSSETLLKEISSEKAKAASANADNVQKAGVIAKLTKELADLKKQCKKVTDEISLNPVMVGPCNLSVQFLRIDDASKFTRDRGFAGICQCKPD